MSAVAETSLTDHQLFPDAASPSRVLHLETTSGEYYRALNIALGFLSWADVMVAPKDSVATDKFGADDVDHVSPAKISIARKTYSKVYDAPIDGTPTEDASTSTTSPAMNVETLSYGLTAVRGEPTPVLQHMNGLNPRADIFIPRRKLPPVWQTQCRWTIPPYDNGRGVDNCRYGRKCNFGHVGEEYFEYPGLKQSFTNGTNTTLSARIHGRNLTSIFNPHPYHITQRPAQASTASITVEPKGYYSSLHHFTSPSIPIYHRYPVPAAFYRPIQPAIQQYPSVPPFNMPQGGSEQPDRSVYLGGRQYPVPNDLFPKTPSECAHKNPPALKTTTSGQQKFRPAQQSSSRLPIPTPYPTMRAPVHAKALTDMPNKTARSDDGKSHFGSRHATSGETN